MDRHKRLVVCALGQMGGPLDLPGSAFDAHSGFITGGERSLYELAVAGAVLGLDVELRGSINRAILGEITSAAGAAPAVGLQPRPPTPSDLVVFPEVFERSVLASAWMSGAAVVVYLLAPPGLFGWSFLDGWSPVDLDSVPVDSVGRPPTFQAIAGLGIGMWTNAGGIEAAGRRAGVAVTWLGTGTPVPFPDLVDKTHDVAVVTHNRWSGWASEIAESIAGASVLRIPPIPSVYSLAPFLAPARVLMWPSRIEGMSRISREARSVGTVPVALDTNPFALASDHGGGVVLVPDRSALGDAVVGLLPDRERLCLLAGEGRSSAIEQADWKRFVVRVGDAVAAATAGPAAPARVGLGRSVLDPSLAVTEESAALRSQLESVTAQRDRAVADLADSRREVDAHRARLVARLVDGSRLGRAYAAGRARFRR